MAVKSFRDLEVWQLSMEMVESVYRITSGLPDHERYGLTSQTRRAAVSIPANIAEGHNRRLEKPYRNHVNIALGSQAEIDTLLELTTRLKFLRTSSLVELNEQVRRVGQMLFGLHRSLGADRTGDD
jgi:four helix bundle protein